jgi:hypothetical protein
MEIERCRQEGGNKILRLVSSSNATRKHCYRHCRCDRERILACLQRQQQMVEGRIELHGSVVQRQRKRRIEALAASVPLAWPAWR